MASQFNRVQAQNPLRDPDRPKVSHDLLKGWILPLPPLAEQREIARYIHCNTESIDQTINAAEEVIRYLTERRSAIISAAVTGHIDVRHGQPSGRTPESAAANQEATV